MDGLKAKLPMPKRGLVVSNWRNRESLFARRALGGAFVIGLVLLGLAFPVLI
jgi:hypothetical protein